MSTGTVAPNLRKSLSSRRDCHRHVNPPAAPRRKHAVQTSEPSSDFCKTLSLPLLLPLTEKQDNGKRYFGIYMCRCRLARTTKPQVAGFTRMPGCTRYVKIRDPRCLMKPWIEQRNHTIRPPIHPNISRRKACSARPSATAEE